MALKVQRHAAAAWGLNVEVIAETDAAIVQSWADGDDLFAYTVEVKENTRGVDCVTVTVMLAGSPSSIRTCLYEPLFVWVPPDHHLGDITATIT